MKSYRTLALKELLSQKVTSILILIAVVLSTMMTTIVGQSIGVLSAMREQQAIAIGGNRYATFLQMNADQLHALEQDERLSYVGKSIYMGSLELSPSLTLGLMEYLDDTAAIYPSSTSVEEGRLPEAPMEIALSEDILKYLGFEGGIGDKITLSLQKNLRHNIADSYSYTAEFVLTGILKNNYLGYTSGTVTGVVGEGTAEQLLPESYIYYNVDIQTADKKSFQAVVDDFNKELNIHELDTSYNIVYLNALGISYTANSEDANDKGFSFMTVAGILVGSLILLAAGLVIYNILKISVSKRIKGYGTLRAIGSEKGQLYQIIVIEVTLLCLIGIPIGMLLGFLSARGILETATGLVSPELFLVQDSSELKTLIAENSSLNGTLLILSGAITLAFALFAALPAARSAARVSPIMAMSGTNLKIRRRKRKTKKIHNFEAYYARLNLKRNKGRTAITILSLVMSITVFIALQGFSSLLNAASALQDNHLGDYQITNESVGFTADDLNTLKKNKAVQSVAAIQFSLYEQNENGQLDGISLEFQLKPGETFQVVGLNDEYWDYFMGDQLPEEQLGQLKSGNACIVRNPIPMSYGEDVLEFTNMRNVIAVIAIALTTFLFTAVLTIGMGAKGTLEYNMAKMIGTGADALVQGLSEEQFQQLKENSMFEKVGCWVPIEIMTNTNRMVAEIDYADQPQLELRMQTPRTGSAPQKANEVLVSANILKDLNIEEKIGAEIPIEFKNRQSGQMYHFDMIVSGIYDTPNEKSESVIVSKAFMEENPEMI